MAEQNVRYDNNVIADFCRYTRDSNALHDPVKMGDLPAIVPGMLTLSSALNTAAEHIRNINMIYITFTDMLLSGDTVNVRSETVSSTPLEIRLSAYNPSGKDVLSYDGRYSRAAKIEDTSSGYFEGPERRCERIEITESVIQGYSDLVGAKEPATINLLLSICMISPTFIRGINEPKSEVQVKIRSLLERKMLPSYESLEILLPDRENCRNLDAGHIDYYISQGREIEPNKTYSLDVDCKSKNQTIYRARCTLRMLPERAIKMFIRKKQAN